MTQLIPLTTDHIVGYRIEGTVSETDFDRIARAIEDKLKQHDKLQLYVEIASFKGISLEALLKDFVFGIKYFNRFDRIVVVTDKDWINKVVSLEGALIPGLEANAFTFDEKERAMEWLLAPAEV